MVVCGRLFLTLRFFLGGTVCTLWNFKCGFSCFSWGFRLFLVRVLDGGWEGVFKRGSVVWWLLGLLICWIFLGGGVLEFGL